MISFLKKDNFEAWNVRIEDFPKNGSLQQKIEFLLNFAVLAPSTHNSQPWKFHVENDTLTIMPAMERALAVGDPTNRLLYFSIGCALENILVAAEFYELSNTVDFENAEKVVKVRFSIQEKSKISAKNADLINVISLRCTNRANFTAEPLPQGFIDWLNGLSDSDVQASFIQDKGTNDGLRDLINVSTPAVMGKPEFRKELAGMLRSNITNKKTGMPAYVMGVPNLPSLLAPLILKIFDISRVKKEFIPNTTGFATIASRTDDFKDIINSGRLYEKICLMAVKYKIFSQPLAAPVHNERYRVRFAKILKTSFKPQFIFRLGFSDVKPLRSPRIPARECLN